MQCSQHMQKERAAELLREAQGGLRRDALTSTLIAAWGRAAASSAEAAVAGQRRRVRLTRLIDQGARAQRPLSLFIGSFSPLIIRSSFLTSPPAAHKGALNGCAFGGAMSNGLP